MSLRIVVDMNLSMEWTEVLANAGYAAVHWSTVGDPKAKDAEIMAWALANDHVVFTHDLDFGTMLALTYATGPTVLQVRGQKTLPEDIESTVIAALRQHESDMISGALVVVDPVKTRVRVLPLHAKPDD